MEAFSWCYSRRKKKEKQRTWIIDMLFVYVESNYPEILCSHHFIQRINKNRNESGNNIRFHIFLLFIYLDHLFFSYSLFLFVQRLSKSSSLTTGRCYEVQLFFLLCMNMLILTKKRKNMLIVSWPLVINDHYRAWHYVVLLINPFEITIGHLRSIVIDFDPQNKILLLIFPSEC